MKERYGLPVVEEDLARAEREAEQYERKFKNRKEQWDKRKDWGRWWEVDEEKQKLERERQRIDARENRVQRAQGRVGAGGEAAEADEGPDDGADADREE